MRIAYWRVDEGAYVIGRVLHLAMIEFALEPNESVWLVPGTYQED